MEHTQELAQQIRTRIGELESDLAAHRRALAVLERRTGRNRPSSNGSVGRRSHGRDFSTEAVFAALAEGNDQAAVIAQEFGVSTAAVRRRLEQLEEGGRVTRSGQRRGTRWHTDGN